MRSPEPERAAAGGIFVTEPFDVIYPSWLIAIS
jgi:hypothetical protein